MSRQLTIRYDDELGERIDRLAEAEGTSRNRIVLRLLRKAAGLEPTAKGRDAVGDSLDWFIGSWSPDQATELAEATEDFERIDEAIWK